MPVTSVDETIRCIAPTNIVGADGAPLCIGYKTSAHMMTAGVYLTDDGYVLAVTPEEGHNPSLFIRPTARDIAKYQEQGALQNPLPPYSIPIGDYLWGYSLWIILAAMAPFYLVVHRSARKRAAAQAPKP
jgi:uncharacterized protein